VNIFNVAASSLSTVNTHATDALSHGSFYCHASGWQRLSSIYRFGSELCDQWPTRATQLTTGQPSTTTGPLADHWPVSTMSWSAEPRR